MAKISATNKVMEYMRKEALKPESAFKMPTMKQLTQKFKVSLVTVTRAVKALEAEGVIICRHGSGMVAARESCLEANHPAQDKSTNKGAIVLAAVDFPSDKIWERIYTVEQYVKQCGYKIISCKIHQDTNTSDIVDFVKQQKDCSGLLLIPGAIQFSYDDVQLYEPLGVPVVFIHSMFDYEALPENVYQVGPDSKMAAELLTEHLYLNGHRNIGLIRNEPATEFAEKYVKNVAGFLRNSKEKAKLFYFPSIIRNWGNSTEESRRITRENIKKIRESDITALIYLSSNGAFSALPILKESGFRIPDDLSVISNSDSWFCEYSEPALTATVTDCEMMCIRAVDIVGDPELRKIKHFKVKEKLIVRNSVKQINKEHEGEKKKKKVNEVKVS